MQSSGERIDQTVITHEYQATADTTCSMVATKSTGAGVAANIGNVVDGQSVVANPSDEMRAFKATVPGIPVLADNNVSFAMEMTGAFAPRWIASCQGLR